MSAHVLLNLLNKLGKSDKMQGLQSILSLFRNEFNKFTNTGAQMFVCLFCCFTSQINSYGHGGTVGARMLDSIYHMILDSIYHMTLRLL